MKSIISWKNFIVEKQLDLFQDTFWEKPELKYNEFWPISKEDLKELLYPLEDEGYKSYIIYGFVENYDNDPYVKDYFQKREVIPSISIIVEEKKPSREDCTDLLLSFVERVKPKFKKIIFQDDESGNLNLKDIRLENGIVYTLEEDDEIDLQSLNIVMMWHKQIHLTDKMIFDYYNWTTDSDYNVKFDEKGNATLVLTGEELSNMALSRNSEWRSPFVNGFNEIWERCWDWIGRVSTDDLFNYHLNLENIKLIIDYIIDDSVWKTLKPENKGSVKTSSGLNLRFASSNYPVGTEFLNGIESRKELLTNKFSKANFEDLYELLEEITPDLIEELRDLYDNEYLSVYEQHVSDQIINSFEKAIEEGLNTNVVEVIWNDDEPSFRITFNMDWLSNIDDRSEGLNYMIRDWAYRNSGEEHLKPYFDDYVSIDTKDFNIQVKALLTRAFERSKRTPTVIG